MLHYESVGLHRRAELRGNGERIHTMLHSAHARILPIMDGKPCLARQGTTQIVMLSQDHALFRDICTHRAHDCTYLGDLSDTHIFAVALDALGALDDTSSLDYDLGEFCDLRSFGALLSPQEAGLLAYAKGLLHWQKTHRFCSQCGQAARRDWSGHRCICPDCSHVMFPRTDPAIITTVEWPAQGSSPAQILLGRAHQWPPGVYSTLAGFVEPGESLEMAVQREIWEEVAVPVKAVRYFASQPWPFHASLMVGFTAHATAQNITLNQSELDDARWFSKEDIARFGNWHDDHARHKLPRTDSIACHLIMDWLAR
ncbi:MAG: NAD(+) diphosphatase [Pseudomonadota bacterium]